MEYFTFATISYNQEKYILEHLESIRYQIETYSNKKRVFYLLCDDHSGDRTVLLAKKWLEEHKNLFIDYKIIESEINSGLVNNFTKALREIKTKAFKILAGDDIYLHSDLINTVINNNGVIISPVLAFNELLENSLNIIKESDYIAFKHRENGILQKYIYEKLKYQICVAAPGVFFNGDLIDDGVYKTLMQYKWIEDAPLWHYLLGTKKIDITLNDRPLIGYRSEVGISSSKKNEKNNEFEKENKIVESKLLIHGNSHFRSKYLNPFAYEYKIDDIVVNKLLRGTTKEYLRCVWLEEKNMFHEYYMNIKKRGDEFYMKYLESV